VDWPFIAIPDQRRLSTELRADRFEGQARLSTARANTTRAIAIPRDSVQELFMKLTKVGVWDVDYVPRWTHTDDYPVVSITIQTTGGLLEIETRSQAKLGRYDAPTDGAFVDRTPWAIVFAGRAFVVYANDLDKALDALEPYLRRNEIFKELFEPIGERR
jgi:hypothetical protein